MDFAMDTVDYVFPHPKDTVGSLFRGWSCYGSNVGDDHPEPLRLFREHGLTCPDGWYVVRARVAQSRKQALTLTVEMNPPRPHNPSHLYARYTYRTVWYTPSPEHANETARQVAVYERLIHMSYAGYQLPLYSPTAQPGYLALTPTQVGWTPLSVDVQVYRRDGDTPHLVSVRRTPFLQRPRAV